MSLKSFPIEDMLTAIDIEIAEARSARRDPGSAAHRHYEVLKAIAGDLRGRQALPRSNALGEMERAIFQAIRSKSSSGYDDGKMNAIAQVVINKWHTIRQALERFGEESSE